MNFVAVDYTARSEARLEEDGRGRVRLGFGSSISELAPGWRFWLALLTVDSCDCSVYIDIAGREVCVATAELVGTQGSDVECGGGRRADSLNCRVGSGGIVGSKLASHRGVWTPAK